MSLNIAIPPFGLARAGRVNPMIVLRVATIAACLCIALSPAFAAEPLRLKAEVTVDAEVLTLADLVEGAAGAAAEAPLFRAPALGESGTIQAGRIGEAAARFGLALAPGGTSQVLVRRAARRVSAAEIEAALKQALELRYGVDRRGLSIVFDGTPPSLLVAPKNTAPVTVENLAYDQRSRRVSAVAFVTAAQPDRRASVQVAGAALERVEVAVLTRALGRGETVQAADVAVERRPRESLPADVIGESDALAGRVARRSLAAGSVLRAGDLARPEVVARNDIVTVVYEIPGLTLTLRGRATEAGAEGDSIAVLNMQSKKTLQARVLGPGKVSVSLSGPIPGPLAVNTAALRAQP